MSGNDQNGHRRAGGNPPGNGSRAQALKPPALVSPEHDQVWPERTDVKQDGIGRVAVLNLDAERDLGPLGFLLKGGDQCTTLGGVPVESLCSRDDVHDDQFGAIGRSTVERVLECTA
jgi:hypothetical protein